MNGRFYEDDLKVREQARRAFRQRRRIRHATMFVAWAAAVILAGLITSWRRDPATFPLAVARPAAAPAPAAARVAAETLSDEGLIAKFPPGSCFIAEVNGKKVLVFTDAAVERAFFQSSFGER